MHGPPFPGTTGSPAYLEAIAAAAQVVARAAAGEVAPVSGASAAELHALLAELDPFPAAGMPLEAVLGEIEAAVVAHSAMLASPRWAAHLLCPPAVPALAAEVVLSALNQSLDSFDQAPAASVLEQHVVRHLLDVAGYGAGGDGVFTSGGTLSNQMGLLLARDAHALRATGRRVQQHGLPSGAHRWRVLCSSAAHFSVAQACAVLGLGHQAVATVPAGGGGELPPAALAATAERVRAEGDEPFAVVGTAGTTDAGALDPLDEIAAVAGGLGAWFHVDAAAGGALLFSERHRHRLAGIERSDSVAIDFHKGFLQPVSGAAFLVRDAGSLELLHASADYLNRAEDEVRGVPNLVGKSLQTTRRFDALKLFVTMRTAGRDGFAGMVDGLLDLGTAAGRLVEAHPELELAMQPQTVVVLFRCRPPGGGSDPAGLDHVNAEVHRLLYERGRAVIGRTVHAGAVHLKLTFLNPAATEADVAEILADVVAVAREVGRTPAA